MMMDRTRSHRSVLQSTLNQAFLPQSKGQGPGVEPYPEGRQVGAHPPYSVSVSIEERSEHSTLCAVQPGAEPPTVVRSGKCEE